MATYNPFDDFTEQLGAETHDLDTDTLKVALTNTAPTQAQTQWSLTLHPDPAAANGYISGGKTSAATWSQSDRTATLVNADVTWTATGAGIGPIRYAVLYNSSATSPANAAIAFWDYGSSITVANGETFTVDFGASTLTLQGPA